jgi:type I restriction enzyme S subunit
MLPDHWPKHTLSEVCDLVNGNGFKASDWDTTGLPIIRIQNLNGSREFNYFNGEVQPRWLVEPGDLLFAWAGVKGVSFGPRIWNGPRGVLNQHIFRVVPKNVVTKEYLYAVMGLVTSRIEAKSHGFKANFVHVQRGDILDQLVAVPPLPVQEKIAAILTTWNRAVELTEKLIAAMQERKAALMQQLLTGKVRLPGFTGEWRHEEIGQYLDECSSRVPSTTALPIYTSSRAGLKPQEEYYAGRTVTNDGEYGVVPINCFVFRHMSDDGLFVFHINQTGGDIAVSKEYPVFRAINLDRHFLLAKLNHTSEFRAFAVSQKAGGTRTRLYFSRLRLWKTFLPSLPEQQAIAAVLNTADEEIDLHTRKLDALRRQKKGLMQQLLTGKVRVKVTESSGE